MKQINLIHELAVQECTSIRGGSITLPPATIELLQSLNPEYISQLIADIISLTPPPQFPTK